MNHQVLTHIAPLNASLMNHATLAKLEDDALARWQLAHAEATTRRVEYEAISKAVTAIQVAMCGVTKLDRALS